MTAECKAISHVMEGKGYRVKVLLPQEKGSYPLYYLLTAEDDTELIWQLIENKQLGLVNLSVDMEKWNHHMSPWKAPALTKKMPDFTGGAMDYLKELEEVRIPEIEKKMKEQGYAPVERGIAGYSMGGLFALYAMTKTQLFSQAASVSGSLWYEGFAEYMEKQVIRKETSWYLSLGNREAKTRNERMAQVEKCTLEIADFLKEQADHVFYETNEGGHFQDVPLRMAKAIVHLSSTLL